ncbi:MAG TPA: IS21 family transposase, partial [Desulfotomaculum sp.]|nr:IS21 family transposase [Desulfotomaculum sp.]
MLAMAQIQYIKHMRDKEDRMISEIARTVNVDWRTAKKYADREDWNLLQGKRRTKKRPVMGPVEEIIDTWLLEDRLLPKKQRHTAKKIYDRLTAEHGFLGGERTVREYVALRKRELKVQEQERYAKLEHPGGEAQADFAAIRVIEAGKFKEIKCLILSFPYSNAGFPYAVPAENAECLLEALRRLFERIGGVPPKVWFDNLPPAVRKLLTGGDRQLTETFQRFCLHYRFEPVFCNTGRGNEKGNVENKVGFTRRNWFVPVPGFAGWEQINADLWQRAEEDMHRPHYEKHCQIAELWVEEKAKLLPLPGVPFEVVRVETATVDKYARIRFDGDHYDLPRGNPGEVVLLKVYWDRIEILNGSLQLLSICGRPYSAKEALIDWVAHLELFRRKPRALAYSSLVNHLPAALKEYFLSREGSLRRQRIERATVCAGRWLEQNRPKTPWSVALKEELNRSLKTPSLRRDEPFALSCCYVAGEPLRPIGAAPQGSLDRRGPCMWYNRAGDRVLHRCVMSPEPPRRRLSFSCNFATASPRTRRSC